MGRPADPAFFARVREYSGCRCLRGVRWPCGVTPRLAKAPELLGYRSAASGSLTVSSHFLTISSRAGRPGLKLARLICARYVGLSRREPGQRGRRLGITISWRRWRFGHRLGAVSVAKQPSCFRRYRGRHILGTGAGLDGRAAIRTHQYCGPLETPVKPFMRAPKRSLAAPATGAANTAQLVHGQRSGIGLSHLAFVTIVWSVWRRHRLCPRLPLLVQEDSYPMTEPVTAIYHPPRKGLPYVVVTFLGDAVAAVPARTLAEARSLAVKTSRAVTAQNQAPKAPD